jgi:serine/threonine protein kinase
MLGEPQEAQLTIPGMDSKRVWLNWQVSHADTGNDPQVACSPIEELAALLMAPKPEELCVPCCLGYCVRKIDGLTTPGLVFEYPTLPGAQSRLCSLLQVMHETSKPSLTHRVVLAQKLVQCLLYLHSVNWLHKGIRSENIFLSPSSTGGYDLRQPILTGFDHSRRAWFNQGTNEVPRIGSMEVYSHPDAQSQGPKTAFRKTFDIYSLGLVLLEIGVWRPISTIMGFTIKSNVEPNDTAKVQQRLLEDEPTILDVLKAEAGEWYTEAVRFCVAARDSFNISPMDQETSTATAIMIQREYNDKVVKALRRIQV